MTQQLDLKNYRTRHTFKSKVARLIWNGVWLFFFRPTPERGFKIFDLWRIFLLRLFEARIGNGRRVFLATRVWASWNLSMGDYSSLGEEVFCYNVAPISLGRV